MAQDVPGGQFPVVCQVPSCEILFERQDRTRDASMAEHVVGMPVRLQRPPEIGNTLMTLLGSPSTGNGRCRSKLLTKTLSVFQQVSLPFRSRSYLLFELPGLWIRREVD
ncbi:hypothetical protein BC830DRAFT_1140971 [Chytriomyces sp. MP71]|nr:hypothetical protein BC830DRAFT_1140971 [Chytriomyces sp. MP71]